jgi:hypothetical protein
LQWLLSLLLEMLVVVREGEGEGEEKKVSHVWSGKKRRVLSYVYLSLETDIIFLPKQNTIFQRTNFKDGLSAIDFN